MGKHKGEDPSYQSPGYPRPAGESPLPKWAYEDPEMLECVLNWFAEPFARAKKHESRCRELEAEITVLNARLGEARIALDATMAERGRLKGERDRLDLRLSGVMKEMSVSDRGTVSLAGSESRPEKIAFDFKEYRKRLRDLISQVRVQGVHEDAKEFAARGVAAVSRRLFLRGAEILCIPTKSVDSAAFEVWQDTCEELKIGAAEAAASAAVEVVTVGFDLLRRLVFSTAPEQPGTLIYPQKNTAYHPNLHDLWPGSFDDPGSTVALTVYPGYEVGGVSHARPIVTTAPPAISIASIDRLA